MALQILYFVPGNLQAPRASFDAIVGRLLVSPVLQVLVFGNAKEEVRLCTQAALTLDPERPRPPLPRPCCCLSGGRGRRVPVLRQTRRWVDDVTRWRFRQIIPCHFSAPVKAGPREFRRVPPVPPLPRVCRERARAPGPRRLAAACALPAAGRPSTLPTVLLRRPARRGAARSRRRQAARHPGKGCSAGCWAAGLTRRHLRHSPPGTCAP